MGMLKTRPWRSTARTESPTAEQRCVPARCPARCSTHTVNVFLAMAAASKRAPCRPPPSPLPAPPHLSSRGAPVKSMMKVITSEAISFSQHSGLSSWQRWRQSGGFLPSLGREGSSGPRVRGGVAEPARPSQLQLQRKAQKLPQLPAEASPYRPSTKGDKKGQKTGRTSGSHCGPPPSTPGSAAALTSSLRVPGVGRGDGLGASLFQAGESGQGTDETGLTFQRPPPHNDLLSFPAIINHLPFYSGPRCFI
ncbi:uncharacterized protein LOC114223500 isoform X3 [Eumetopias jubatus]|uniref:uncharacterized protein LOC114223500 isoform X3 n=1 Tax=Eumetopias jubatus TaxID=34886 RepID=UPI001016A057|nr:uncharacterized protein LOC114223500 isoform X3 [Eumetopias jubatus]